MKKLILTNLLLLISCRCLADMRFQNMTQANIQFALSCTGNVEKTRDELHIVGPGQTIGVSSFGCRTTYIKFKIGTGHGDVVRYYEIDPSVIRPYVLYPAAAGSAQYPMNVIESWSGRALPQFTL